jgi:hypothetical protein
MHMFQVSLANLRLWAVQFSSSLHRQFGRTRSNDALMQSGASLKAHHEEIAPTERHESLGPSSHPAGAAFIATIGPGSAASIAFDEHPGSVIEKRL